MNENTSVNVLIFLVGIIIGMIIFGVILTTIPKEKFDLYKFGQIDAINGVINYELEDQSDGSKKWVLIEKKK